MSILENPKYSYLIGKQSIFFRFWKKIFYYYCNTVFSLYTPVKISGRENLPSESAIFCSNHNSHMDVALISSAAGKSFNHFGMLAAIDYWFDSRIKKILTNFVMNLIPIARKSSAKDGSISFQDTIALCRRFMDYGNRNIVINQQNPQQRQREIERIARIRRNNRAIYQAKPYECLGNVLCAVFVIILILVYGLGIASS